MTLFYLSLISDIVHMYPANEHTERKGKIMFNEKQFQRLVKETEDKVISLGTTSNVILRRHRKFAKQLSLYLKNKNLPFDLDLCLQWIGSMKPDTVPGGWVTPVERSACRRFVILLAQQKAGNLNSWECYLKKQPEMPKSEDFLQILLLYSAYLSKTGIREETSHKCVSYARRLLTYMEKYDIAEIKEIDNKALAGYFLSPRFHGRKPGGIRAEHSVLKKFIVFLEEHKYTGCHSLHYAIPHHYAPVKPFITTLTPEMVADIMQDKQGSRVDKRDKAVCLLALHIGLRSCDIRNLKFEDINWEKGILTIQQSKTGAELQMPLDHETQNAVIDYVLNERRECSIRFIFIPSTGPARKLARSKFRIKYRAENTGSYEKIPHDGLHIFRRTFASRLLQDGVPLLTISKMLGHVGENAVQCYLSTDELKMKRCALGLTLIPYRRGEF